MDSSKIPISSNRPCRTQSTNKDEKMDTNLANHGKHLSRSVSLKRNEGSLERKRLRSPSPKVNVSPQKKASVLERKKALERKYMNRLKEKEKNEKCFKESLKEKREKEKKRREAKESEESSDEETQSLAKMMKIMMKDIKEVKGEMKSKGERMDNLGKKLNKLEVRTKTNEEKYEKKFEDIQLNFEKQIKENNAALQESISKSIIESLKPKITAMHSHIVETDLKRIVDEKLQEREAPGDEDDDPVESELIEESNKEAAKV